MSDHDREEVKRACSLIKETLSLNQISGFHAFSAFFTLMMRGYMECGASYEEFRDDMREELKRVKGSWKAFHDGQ